MKTVKKIILTVIEVIQDTKKLQTEEMKKRYFQR
jgi:hypothetical protein